MKLFLTTFARKLAGTIKKNNNKLVSKNIVCVCVSRSVCPTLCNPLNPPDFSVHGISSGKNTLLCSVPFSRGFSQPRDQTQVCYIIGRFFTIWDNREAPKNISNTIAALGNKVSLIKLEEWGIPLGAISIFNYKQHFQLKKF